MRAGCSATGSLRAPSSPPLTPGVLRMRVRSLMSAVALTAATFAATGTTAASAADCNPLTVSYGGTSVTVCLAPSFPPPGYPSVGAYVALDGYVQVCTPGCITLP